MLNLLVFETSTTKLARGVLLVAEELRVRHAVSNSALRSFERIKVVLVTSQLIDRAETREIVRDGVRPTSTGVSSRIPPACGLFACVRSEIPHELFEPASVGDVVLNEFGEVDVRELTRKQRSRLLQGLQVGCLSFVLCHRFRRNAVQRTNRYVQVASALEARCHFLRASGVKVSTLETVLRLGKLLSPDVCVDIHLLLLLRMNRVRSSHHRLGCQRYRCS